eukprot:18822-Heterococcus_DN1.PRE.1
MKCPVGGVGGVNAVQTITCDATDGYFTLEFRGNVTGKIVATADAARVQRALQRIAQIRNVTVVQEAVAPPQTQSVCGHPARTSTIEFLTEHGDVPTLKYVSGLSIVYPPTPAPATPPAPEYPYAQVQLPDTATVCTTAAR